MRRDILLPALALAGGTGGFLLRRWQWASAYDEAAQLFRPGAPATWAVAVLLAGLAAAFLLLCRRMRPEEDFLPAYRCPSTLFMTVMAASAFLFLGAGALGLLDGMDALAQWRAERAAAALAGNTPPPVSAPAALLLCAALCFPSGLAVLLLGRAAYREELTPAASLLASCPPFAGLAWLFATHLSHGSDPALLSYGFVLLAAGLLTLADRPGRTAALLALAFSLSALAYACALLRNGYGPAWPRRMLPRAGSGQKDGQTEEDQ